MIIGSFVELLVGRRYDEGLVDDKGVTHEGMPCVVLRVATREEWRAQAEAEGVAPHLITAALADAEFARFYEVSVD